MLAMKFLHYQQDHSHLAAADDEPGTKQQQQPGKPPSSLYNLAAAMIKVTFMYLTSLKSVVHQLLYCLHFCP
jgi:hypothetical protein